MGRPRRISDEDIAREARVVFLEQGPSASTERIAARLGVSQAALFKRIPTKDALLILALSPGPLPRSLQQLGMGPDEDRPVPQQLTELLRAAFHCFREFWPALLTLKASGAPPLRLLVGEGSMVIKLREDFTLWLKLAHRQRRVRGGEMRCVVEMLLGGLQSRALLEHLGTKRESAAQEAAYIHELVRAAWRGLAPEL